MNGRVAELRKVLSLSMEEFGKKLGVTRSSISNIESGRRGLTDQMILSICREFNVSEEWIRFGAGDMFQKEAKNEIEALVKKYDLNQLEYIFLEHYLNLEDSARKEIFNFIIDLFSDFNESPVALHAPAKIFRNEQLPYEAFKVASPRDIDIDAEVEAYRQQLELQKKAAARSSLSNGGNGGANKKEA